MRIVDVRLPGVFPPWNILIALIGTVALALLVLFLPMRRAVRFLPGNGLRYAEEQRHRTPTQQRRASIAAGSAVWNRALS